MNRPPSFAEFMAAKGLVPSARTGVDDAHYDWLSKIVTVPDTVTQQDMNEIMQRAGYGWRVPQDQASSACPAGYYLDASGVCVLR